MQKIMGRLFILVSVIFILASCSAETEERENSETDENETAEEEESSDSSSEKADQEEEKQPSETIDDVSSSLINDENLVKERETIEGAMKKQRTLLKPGFMKNNEFTYNVQFLFGLNEDFIEYTQSYELGDDAFSFLISGYTTSKSLEEDYDKYEVEESFETDKTDFNLSYSDHADDAYRLWSKYNDEIYEVFGHEDEEEYSKELVADIANSLKTEEEGAYDPIYEILDDIDFENMKFPKIDEGKLDDSLVELLIDQEDTTVDFTYKINMEQQLRYRIQTDPFPDFNNYDEEDTVSIEDTNVTIYKDDITDTLHYAWNDDHFYYTITNSRQPENGELEEEDLFAIIKSSLMDDREFTDWDVFEPQYDNDYSKDDEQLYDELKQID